MKQPPNIGLLDVQKLEFSASAYEMAIAMQLRILEAERSEHTSRQLYQENKKRMSKIRGLLEDIVQSDSVVIDKPLGMELKRHYAWLEQTLDNTGTVCPAEFGSYFKGIASREK